MTHRLHAVCLATLSVFASCIFAETGPTQNNTAQVGPKERDVWYEYVQDGVRYGSQHVTVARTAAGNFRYTVESKHLIDLFSSQKQTTVTTAVFLVSPGLRPISVTAESSDLTGKTRTTGQMQGDEFVVSSRFAGAVSEQRIACGDTSHAIFEVCVEDLLASLAASVERTTVQRIGENSQVEDLIATRQSSDADAPVVWRVDAGLGYGVSTLTFDESGVLVSLVSKLPRIEMRRCTREQASKLVHRNIDGREVLTFELDKTIRKPDRLRKIDVRLTWTDIPFAELELEDARQRIVKKSVEGERRTVVLSIAPPTAAADDRTIPIEDAALAPYLAETAFIKPKHDKILAAARTAVADVKNAAAAVRVLSTWVNGHVEGQLAARTLTGPEVLECRSGKCTEFATLFASMARSIGIPTRIALGERMLNGSWMGHMWNEAYVGRWITVDAGYNEVDESQVLLKFIHSDTVAGTQPVRWKLTSSLDISIESFELTPSKLAKGYKTGIEGSTYTNVDYACRIEASDAGWTLSDKSTPAAVTIRFRLDEAPGVFIHFVAFALPAGTPPKVIIDNRLKMFRGTYTELDLQQSEVCKVAGATGYRSRFTGVTKGKSSLKNFTTEVVWVNGDSGYLMNLIALEGPFTKYLPQFEKLLAGFQFLQD